MLLGDKSAFAVELETWRGSGNQRSTWFAHTCYWVTGTIIGDFEQAVVLSAEAAAFSDILSWRGTRRSRELSSLPESEALLRVHETLWGRASGGRSVLFGSTPEEYVRFWILPAHSEAFQGERAILLGQDGEEKIIWQTFGASEVRFAVLRTGTFDAVLEEAVMRCRTALTGHDEAGTTQDW